MSKGLIPLVLAGAWLVAGVVEPAAADVLTNKAGGLALEVAPAKASKNNARARLWARNGKKHQQWKVVPVGDGYVKIVNRAGGLVLDAWATDVDKDGCRVILHQYAGQHNQQWKFQKVGKFFKIINRASGKVLDAHRPDVSKNGCRIQLWRSHKGPSCLWQLGD